MMDGDFEDGREFEDYNGEDEYVLWERKRREAIVQAVCYIAYAICLIIWHSRSRSTRSLTDKRSLELSMRRGRRRNEVMKDLKVPRTCQRLIRMSPTAFLGLCRILKEDDKETEEYCNLFITTFRWNKDMDKVFIDALTNEQLCGNRVDGNFTTRAYENMVNACTEKLGRPFTKEQLKNRLKTLKSNFGEAKDLFNASGWGWNEEISMFENDDEVWKALIEQKPEAERWRGTPFYHFDLLYKLF